MSNQVMCESRRGRAARSKMRTLSLDEQVQDFMDARGGLRLYDTIYAEASHKLLPRRLADLKTKRA